MGVPGTSGFRAAFGDGIFLEYGRGLGEEVRISVMQAHSAEESS